MRLLPGLSLLHLSAFCIGLLFICGQGCLQLNLEPLAGPNDCQQNCFLLEGKLIQAITQNPLAQTEVMLMRERRGDFGKRDRQAIVKMNTDASGRFQFRIDSELFRSFDYPILVANHPELILEKTEFSQEFDPGDPTLIDVPIEASLYMRPFGYLNLNFKKTSNLTTRIAAINFDCSDVFQEVGFDFTSDTTVALVIPAQKNVCIAIKYTRADQDFSVVDEYFHEAYEVVNKAIEL